MSDQHELRERAALLEELRQIVQAMKNIAFAELQHVSHALPAQALAYETVLQALLALPPQPEPDLAAARSDAPVAWLVIGAERGFCGAFNARLAAQVAELRRDDPAARLLIAGERLYQLAGPEAQGAVLLPGCAAIEDADNLLDEWLAALAREASNCREVWLLHAEESAIERRRLLPEPLPPTSARPAADTPMRYLPLPALRAALVLQCLRLLLQSGLFASLKQENRWRLAQMQRAQDHLDELGQTLRRRRAALRQADITNEQETLMSSVAGETGPASRSPLAASSP